MLTKRRFISLAGTAGLCALVPSLSRPVAAQGGHGARMLVGFGAGGAIDVIARTLVDGMKDYAPAFIVDNRPGAGGRLALGALKAAAADGSAMVLTPASMMTVFPHVYKTLPYDPFRDFIPVTTICSFPFLLTVGPMVPADVRTLGDFAKWCAAHPKQATYGTAAAGSMLHFTGVSLAEAGGFEFVHLPYGGPAGIQDLIGGRIAATIYPIGTALAHVQAGSIRALATTGPRRSPLLADVPTAREAGYPTLEAEEWFGVFLPAGTAASAVQRLHSAISAATSADSFRKSLARLSIDVFGLTPLAFADLLRSDFERWGPIVRASGFSPED